MREERRSIIMARDTLTGPVPMDIGAVHTGKGKGKEKKGSHRKGHRKRDCRVFDRDKKGVNAVEQAPSLVFGAGDTITSEHDRVG